MSAAELIDDVVDRSMRAWKPPPRLKLSEWADRFMYLSAESAAEPGRWKTLPYQRDILDAFSDPTVERVYVMKSARVGWTKCMNIVVGYYMHQAPAPIMVVQPTVEDAEGYSKEEIAPMIRDVPVLAEIMPEPSERESGQTMLHKAFPGGSLTMTGANTGRGFRRTSRKVVLFDETDGYPASAGKEGDQIKLGIRRTDYYHDRKIGGGSTPLIEGASRIKTLYHSGDQRRYYVPCPQCGNMDYFVFRREGEHGHYMSWPKDEPRKAHFVCRKNGCVIEYRHQREMVAKGEWRAHAPFRGIASFHIWAAYSYSPNATWAQLAEEFVEANKGGPEQLQTFVNTVLGETWTEKGDAPEWQRLYKQREKYPMATVPPEVLFITAGVDVQKDRLVYEIVGWAADKQSWSITSGVLPGDTSTVSAAVWTSLDELLNQSWPTDDGKMHSIRMLAIDSGYNTQTVYNWARRHPMSRVVACKGQPKQNTLISTPSPVDVTVRGKKLARGYKVWPIGVNVAKSELYGWLRLEPPMKPEDPVPAGLCHFPEYGEDYFQQLTAEHLVRVVKKSGFAVFEWQLLPGRENHYLDCRILSRAAASILGLDRMSPRGGTPRRPPPAAPSSAAAGSEGERQPDPPPEPPPPSSPKPPREGGGWLGGSRSGGRRGSGWLSRRKR